LTLSGTGFFFLFGWRPSARAGRRFATRRVGPMPALFAALVFVLQASLAAAAAAVPSGPLLDRFGNPLCVTGVEPGRDSHDRGHAGLPECCAAGCPLASSTPAPPPDEVAALLRPPLDTGASFNPSAAHRPAGPDRTPANPRAPPPNG